MTFMGIETRGILGTRRLKNSVRQNAPEKD
jgi:hypothetical protein